MMKNVLITGGAGFIGSHFVDIVLKEKCNVIVLDQLTYAADIKFLPLAKISFIKGNINNQTLVAQLLEKYRIDTVVNFAAESHVDNSIKGPDLFIETNISGTTSLLGCCQNHWRSIGSEFRYVQISTDEVYGSLGDEGYFVEDTPIDPRSPYSASKAAADQLVSAWHHTYGLPTIITRCTNNYGARQHPEKLIPKTITNALEGSKIPVYGNGQNSRDWIHVTDHCNGIVKAIRKGEIGKLYCFGGDSEMKNIDLVTLLCQTLDQILPLPNNESYQSLITFVEDRLGHDFRYAINFSNATKKLGFMPEYDFARGMHETILWYLDKTAQEKAA